jgi:hypothetical protein
MQGDPFYTKLDVEKLVAEGKVHVLRSEREVEKICGDIADKILAAPSVRPVFTGCQISCRRVSFSRGGERERERERQGSHTQGHAETDPSALCRKHSPTPCCFFAHRPMSYK